MTGSYARCRRLGALALCCTLCACATAGTRTAVTDPPAETPARYEGQCAFLGIEEVSGPTDQNADAVLLMAIYSFGAPETAPARRFGLTFRVQRSRVGDLRSHLQQHPNIVCRPGQQQPGTESGYELVVPPFEGQPGTPAGLSAPVP